MKEYIKPEFDIIKIEIEDIILVSQSEKVLGFDPLNVFDESI